MQTKSIFASKTFWLNFLVLVVAIITALTSDGSFAEKYPDLVETLLIALPILNVILRFITDTKTTLFLILFMLFALPAYAEPNAKVLSVTDGDTLTYALVQPDGKLSPPEKGRLIGLDAPEFHRLRLRGQVYGREATRQLAEQTLGKDVRIEAAKRDRYGRNLIRVWVDNHYVNEELVAKGFAWSYMSNEFKTAENLARVNRLGLWSYPRPVAPWIYRNGTKVKTLTLGN